MRTLAVVIGGRHARVENCYDEDCYVESINIRAKRSQLPHLCDVCRTDEGVGHTCRRFQSNARGGPLSKRHGLDFLETIAIPMMSSVGARIGPLRASATQMI